MNIALEGTREFVDGKMRRSYGDAFVRGNNGMFFPTCALSISPSLSTSKLFDSGTLLIVESLLAGKVLGHGIGLLTYSSIYSDVHLRRLIEWFWHRECAQDVSQATTRYVRMVQATRTHWPRGGTACNGLGSCGLYMATTHADRLCLGIRQG